MFYKIKKYIFLRISEAFYEILTKASNQGREGGGMTIKGGGGGGGQSTEGVTGQLGQSQMVKT